MSKPNPSPDPPKRRIGPKPYRCVEVDEILTFHPNTTDAEPAVIGKNVVLQLGYGHIPACRTPLPNGKMCPHCKAREMIVRSAPRRDFLTALSYN